MGLRFLGFCALLAVMSPVSAWSCLWIKGTTLEGAITGHEPAFSPELGAPLSGQILNEHRAGAFADLLQQMVTLQPAGAQMAGVFSGMGNPFPSDWIPETDEAVKPLFQGNYGKARENLMALQAIHPDNYYLCANLAVACELAGDDATALNWVEKALQLKPGAHHGTEWMHAAVLRAKLALAQDPTWLDKHTLTGIPLGGIPKDFQLLDGTKTLTLGDIASALVAHAAPRLLFVKPTDRIAAAMLYELARVEARLTSVEAGMKMLTLAETYGKTGTETLRKEWQEALPGAFVRFFRSAGSNEIMRGVLLIGSIILILAAFLIWSRQRRRRKKA